MMRLLILVVLLAWEPPPAKFKCDRADARTLVRNAPGVTELSDRCARIHHSNGMTQSRFSPLTMSVEKLCDLDRRALLESAGTISATEARQSKPASKEVG